MVITPTYKGSMLIFLFMSFISTMLLFIILVIFFSFLLLRISVNIFNKCQFEMVKEEWRKVAHGQGPSAGF